MNKKIVRASRSTYKLCKSGPFKDREKSYMKIYMELFCECPRFMFLKQKEKSAQFQKNGACVFFFAQAMSA